MKKIVLLYVLLLSISPLTATYAKGPFVICIDAGHGAENSGAKAVWNGKTVHEEELNLKIAKYLKEELETYQNVVVVMTRDGRYEVDLEKRTQIGVEHNADLLVSIHNNANGEEFYYDHGATVLVSRGQYKENMSKEEKELGVNILYELANLGIEDQGLLLRDSTNGEKYRNGEVADYYAIVRNGVINNLPSIIVEHAFVDNKDDYDQFLSSDEKLKKLAIADANGMARYYQLIKNTEVKPLDKLEDVTENVLYLNENPGGQNETYEETFFDGEGEADSVEGLDEEISVSEMNEDSKTDEESIEKKHINWMYVAMIGLGICIAVVLVLSAENITALNSKDLK